MTCIGLHLFAVRSFSVVGRPAVGEWQLQRGEWTFECRVHTCRTALMSAERRDRREREHEENNKTVYF